MTSIENQRQKGLIMLSFARSGTSWLKSISNATGQMGISDEWMGFYMLKKPLRTFTAQSYTEYIMKRASTPNGRFALKIFPMHVRQAQAHFGFDFIRQCAETHDVKFYLLTREDRLGQAISYLKAYQTKKWADNHKPGKLPRNIRYNFRKLCLLYFHIGHEYDFWRSYLGINGFDYESFCYETLLPNPAPYFESAAKHLGVPPPENYESSMIIQRDSVSEEWRQRFLEDMETQGVHPDTYNLKQPDSSLSNALKVLTGRPIKPRSGGAFS